MALRIPPVPPGGGVFCVNSATDIPATPFAIKVHRIAPRQKRPTAVARPERHKASTLVNLRMPRLLMGIRPSYRRERAPVEAHQHEAGGRDDHECDQEQQ